jgi:hypothetical protein
MPPKEEAVTQINKSEITGPKQHHDVYGDKVNLTRKVFDNGLKMLQDLYVKQLTDDVRKQWWFSMKRLTDTQFRSAVQGIINDPESGTYMPKPNDILRRIIQAQRTEDAPSFTDVAYQSDPCPRCTFRGLLTVLVAGGRETSRAWIPDEQGNYPHYFRDVGMEESEDHLLPIPRPPWGGWNIREVSCKCVCHHGEMREHMYPKKYPPINYFRRWTDEPMITDEEVENAAWEDHDAQLRDTRRTRS